MQDLSDMLVLESQKDGTTYKQHWSEAAERSSVFDCSETARIGCFSESRRHSGRGDS